MRGLLGDTGTCWGSLTEEAVAWVRCDWPFLMR